MLLVEFWGVALRGSACLVLVLVLPFVYLEQVIGLLDER